MLSAKRPHLLHKRGRVGGLAIPATPGSSSVRAYDPYQQHHLESHQDRPVRDAPEGDSSSNLSSTGSDANSLGYLLDAHTRKNKSQLTSTEYALQEIRSRVRAIDERWEEVNVRATNTLDNIEGEHLASVDSSGNRRRSVDSPISRRRERDHKVSLRSGSRRGDAPNLLESSRAAAWLNEMGESGRAVFRDERVAVALAQSHENLAAASCRFEEAQERSASLLGELRGWLDSFTGTARPEDVNPIAAMLPDEGVENEVVGLMTDCQDAALMLEQSTTLHTKQLREIFSQAGKLYGSEMEKGKKKGSAISSAFREKISTLEQHANKVETLLNSMQDERKYLQRRLASNEQRASALDERFRADKSRLQAGLEDYRHRVMQLQYVVAGYEEKARRQEQTEREPRLGPILDKMTKPPQNPPDSNQLKQLQAEVAKLIAENADLSNTIKSLNLDLVVLRLAEQSGERKGGRRKNTLLEGVAEPDSPSAEKEQLLASDDNTAAPDEALNETREEVTRLETELREAKQENDSLSGRVRTLHGELEKERKRPTVINSPAADAVEEGLREALRDLRHETNAQLLDQTESHRCAVGELERLLGEERDKGEKAAVAAHVEFSGLRSQLDSVYGELQTLRSTIREEAPVVAPPPTPPTRPPPPIAIVDEAPATLSMTVEDKISIEQPEMLESENTREVICVDYGALVHRAKASEEEGICELRRKAEEVGVAQRHCDKAKKVYSGVVDCCGEGLSSVERILQKSAAQSGREDEDAAASIQAALALALERAITSATLLLREALVGRVRACEAEKQALTEQATAERERTRAAALDCENRSLVEQLQQKQAQTTAVMIELASLRRNSRQEPGVSAKPRALSQTAISPIWKPENNQPEAVQPAVKRESSANESAMWRRRYEHLAGLLADTTKASRPTTPARARRSPRPITTPATKQSSDPTHKNEHQATSSVNTHSQTTGLAEASFSATETEVTSSTNDSSVLSPAAVPLKQNEQNNTTLPGTTNSKDATRAAKGRNSCDSAVQTAVGGGPETSEGGTQVNFGAASDADAVDARVSGDASSGVDAARQYESAPDEAVIATDKPTVPHGSDEGVTLSTSPMTRLETVGESETTRMPPSAVAVVRNTSAAAADKSPGQGGQEADRTKEGEGAATLERNMVENDDNEDVRGEDEHDDDDSKAGAAVEDEAREGSEDRTSGDRPVVQKEHSGDDESNEHRKESARSAWDDGDASDSAVKPFDCDEESDGGTLLEKLLNGATLSATFEDDHEKLVLKVLKSRGDNPKPRGDDPKSGGDKKDTIGQKMQTSCLECPLLRQDLDDRLARLKSAKEQLMAAESDLEASEHRIHVLSSDNAGLKRKLAEYANVVRRARSFADEVVATPSAEIPIAQSAQHFKEICDRVGSPNVIRGGGRNSAKPTDDAAEGRPLAQRSRLGSTNPDAVGQRNTSGRRGPRVSNASAQQQQRPFNRKRLRGDNAQRVFGHEAVARNGAAGPRKSLVPKKRPSGHTRRGFVSGHSGPKVKGGVAGVAAEAAKAPPVSSGRVNSRKERAEDGGVGSGDEMCDADRSSAESADPRDGVGISCIDSVNADDTERTALETSDTVSGEEDEVCSRSSSVIDIDGDAESVKNPAAKPAIGADDRGQPPQAGKFRATSSAASCDGEAESTEISAAKPRRGSDDRGQPPHAGKVRAASSAASRQATDPAGPEPWPRSEGEEGDDAAIATHSVPASYKNPHEREALDESEIDLVELGRSGEIWDTTTARKIGSSSSGSDRTELETTTPDKSGIYPVGLGEDDEAGVTTTEILEESRSRKADKAEPKPAAMDMAEISLMGDFAPTEKSLVAYSKAAARCKLAIQTLESSSSSSSEEGSSFGDCNLEDDGSQEQLQTLTNTYRNLKSTMMDWGVEAVAALLGEITKTAAKHGTISSWLGATNMSRNGDGSKSNSDSSSERRRDRAMRLIAEKAVLGEVINELGGWEAAVFFDGGGVNIDVDTGTWSIEDQVSILSALNDHLRQELERRAEKHRKAFNDMLSRLRAAQKEVEEMRSLRQSELRHEPSSPDAPVESPEATPEEGQRKSTVEENSPLEPLVIQHWTDSTVIDPLNASDQDEENDKEDREENAVVPATQLQIEVAAEDTVVVTAEEQESVEQYDHTGENEEPVEPAEEEEEGYKMAEEVQAVLVPGPVAPPLPHQKETETFRPPPDDSHLAQVVGAKDAEIKQLRTELNVALIAVKNTREELQLEKDRSRDAHRRKKHVDLIAHAEEAELRAKKEEEARINAGYPLAALSAERRAVADLRRAFTKAVCAVLELCCPRADTQLECSTDHGGKEVDNVDVFSQSHRCGPSHVATLNARGPAGMLVQMVCSGDDASVRCATTQYRLQKGVGQADRHGGTNHGKVGSGHGFDVDHVGSFGATLAPATVGGTLRDELLDATPNSGQEQGDDHWPHESQSDLLRMPVSLLPKPPTNVEEALAIARDAATEVQSFADNICSINVGGGRGGSGVAVSGVQSVHWSPGNSGGLLSGEEGTVGLSEGRRRVDTTATARIVDALRADASWAQSLSTFMRNKLEGQAAGFGNQMSLKDREIEILTEAQSELRRDLRALKADYVSADAEDVIRALRKRLRGLNRQVRFLEQQLCLAQESADVEGGSIEVLEGLLRQRDTDTELCRGMGLKSLEIGLKISLLETDTGGQTVEVSRRDQKEQQALNHLKARLIKQREVLAVRKATISAELERSLPHAMRAFERVNRTIQRLCNGYASLPGLLEWGRITAARMEGGDVALQDEVAETIHYPVPRGDSSEKAHSLCTRGGATSIPGRRHERWTKHSACFRNEEHVGEKGFTNSLFPPPRGGSLCSQDGMSGAHAFVTVSRSPSCRAPTAAQSWHPPSDNVFDLPKMLSKGGGIENGDTISLRRRLKTAGHCTGRGNGGVVCDGEHGQPVIGSSWSGVTEAACTSTNSSHLSSLDGSVQSFSNSSVSSLLREEMAFRRRNGGLYGLPEKGKGPANARSSPALVPLNNVGLPVRVRHQPRRTQRL